MDFTITYFDGGEFVSESVNRATIRTFGITNNPIFRADGFIRKYHKSGYIRFCDGEFITNIDIDDIKEIKKSFKSKELLTTKSRVSYPKMTRYGMESRNAVNWSYVVKDKKSV